MQSHKARIRAKIRLARLSKGSQTLIKPQKIKKRYNKEDVTNKNIKKVVP